MMDSLTLRTIVLGIVKQGKMACLEKTLFHQGPRHPHKAMHGLGRKLSL